MGTERCAGARPPQIPRALKPLNSYASQTRAAAAPPHNRNGGRASGAGPQGRRAIKSSHRADQAVRLLGLCLELSDKLQMNACTDAALAWLRAAPSVPPNGIPAGGCGDRFMYLKRSYKELAELRATIARQITRSVRLLVHQVHEAATIVRTALEERAARPQHSRLQFSEMAAWVAPRKKQLALRFKDSLGKYASHVGQTRIEGARLACCLSLYQRALGQGGPCDSQPPQSCSDFTAWRALLGLLEQDEISKAVQTAHALCLQTACADGLKRLEGGAEDRRQACEDLANTVNGSCVAAARASNAAPNPSSTESSVALIGGAVLLAEQLCTRGSMHLTNLQHSEYSTEAQRRAIAAEMISHRPRELKTEDLKVPQRSRPFKIFLAEAKRGLSGPKQPKNAEDLGQPAVRSLLYILASLNKEPRDLALIAQQLVRDIINDSYGHTAGGLFSGAGGGVITSVIKDLVFKETAGNIVKEQVQRSANRQYDELIASTLIRIANAALVKENDSSYNVEISQICEAADARVPALPRLGPLHLLEQRLHNAWEDKRHATKERFSYNKTRQSIVEGLSPLLKAASKGPSSTVAAMNLGVTALQGAPPSPALQEQFQKYVRGESSMKGLLTQHIGNIMLGAHGDGSAETSTPLHKIGNFFLGGDPFDIILKSPVKINKALLTTAVSSFDAWHSQGNRNECGSIERTKSFLQHAVEVSVQQLLDGSSSLGDSKVQGHVVEAYLKVFRNEKHEKDLQHILKNLWLNAVDTSTPSAKGRLQKTLHGYFERLLLIAKAEFLYSGNKTTPACEQSKIELTQNHDSFDKEITLILEGLDDPLKDFEKLFGDVGKGRLVKGALALAAGGAGLLVLKKLHDMVSRTPDHHLPPKLAHDLERAAHGHSLQESLANILQTVANEVPMDTKARQSLRTAAQDFAHNVSMESTPGHPAQYSHGPHQGPPWFPWQSLYSPQSFSGGPPFHGAQYHPPPFHGAQYHPPPFHGAQYHPPPFHGAQYQPLHGGFYHMPAPTGPPAAPAQEAAPAESFSGTLKSLVGGLGGVGGLGSLFSGLWGGDMAAEHASEEDAEMDLRVPDMKLINEAKTHGPRLVMPLPRPVKPAPRLVMPVPRLAQPSPSSTSKASRLRVPS